MALINPAIFNGNPRQAATNGRPLIELTGVYKIYKTGAGEFAALKNINLQFERGDYAAIMGKSGSGKSTLINMITGIDTPTAGIVRVGDVELQHMRQGDISVWRGANMGVVFQFFQLMPMLTVLENTLLPMDFCNMYAKEEREQRAMELLTMVGLEEVVHKLPDALSGGQQQIAAIARSLANDPSIIVADEPTGNLDSHTGEQILELFHELHCQGVTIVLVTHEMAIAARAQRVVRMMDGKVVEDRKVDDAYRKELLALRIQA